MAKGLFELSNNDHTPNAAAACIAVANAIMRVNELCEKQFPDFFQAMIKIMGAR